MRISSDCTNHDESSRYHSTPFESLTPTKNLITSVVADSKSWPKFSATHYPHQDVTHQTKYYRRLHAHVSFNQRESPSNNVLLVLKQAASL